MDIEAERGWKGRVSALLPALVAGVLVGVWVERTGLGRYPQATGREALVSVLPPPPTLSVAGEGTPEGVAEILRSDPGGSGAEDRAPVWAFLRQPSGRTSGNNLEWLLSADEALNWLRGAGHAPAEVENGLVDLAGDRTLPAALREQAMQHLGQWTEARPASKRVLEGFRTAVQEEKSEAIAGVALLALARSRFASAETPWLCATALACVGAEGVSGALREAACDVVERYGLHQAEPELRRVSLAGVTAGERLAALRALGEVGTLETRRWLEVAGGALAGAPLEGDARAKAVERISVRLKAAGGRPH